MKLQCPCGAKYAFEITPVMAYRPVQFICPACGLDSSDFVNTLIRQELGPAPAFGPEPVEPAAISTVEVAPPSTVPETAGRQQVQRVQVPTPASGDTTQVRHCSKHPGQVATH